MSRKNKMLMELMKNWQLLEILKPRERIRAVAGFPGTPLSPLVPLIFGGSYDVNFRGTIYIPK